MVVFFNGEEATQNDKSLWGINFKGNISKLNNGITPERICILPEHIYSIINQNIISRFVKSFNLRGLFNAMHQILAGRNIPETVLEEVISEVKKAKLADIYTFPNYARALRKVFLSHPELYRIEFVEE